MIDSLLFICKTSLLLPSVFCIFLSFCSHSCIISSFVEALLTFLFQSFSVKLIIGYIEKWIRRRSEFFFIHLRSTRSHILLSRSFDSCLQPFNFLVQLRRIPKTLSLNSSLELSFAFCFRILLNVTIVFKIIFVLSEFLGPHLCSLLLEPSPTFLLPFQRTSNFLLAFCCRKLRIRKSN